MKRSLAYLLAFVIAIAIPCCVQAETVSYKDTVYIGMSESCPNMDPQSNTDRASKILWKVMHQPLYMEDENLEAIPGVAETYEQLDDKTYIFHIRKNVFFHNGEELKASDVVYSFTRGKDSSYCSTVCGNIDSITAEDDYTVKMVLVNSNPDWIVMLANYCYVILSEKAMTEDPERGFTIGCGAYTLDEFVLNDHASFTKFDKYYNADAIKSNHLYFRYIPENASRTIALQNGEIDICLNPDTIELPYLESDDNLTVSSVDQTNITFIAFNLNNEVASNMKLRQAVSCALDKQELVDVALNGYGRPAKSFWIPICIGYADDFDTYDYDVERAKQLLLESGLENVTLELTVGDSLNLTVAELVQAQLLQIGINATINQIDGASRSSYTKAGKHQAWIGSNSYNLAFSAYNMHYPDKGSNSTFYNNAAVNQLLDEASAEFDVEKREGLYRDVQVITAEELPYIPLFYKELKWASVKGFAGLISNANGPHEFTYCYVAQ